MPFFFQVQSSFGKLKSGCQLKIKTPTQNLIWQISTEVLSIPPLNGTGFSIYHLKTEKTKNLYMESNK